MEKVSGPAWDGLRPQFHEIVDTLLAVSPTAYADLTTIYIKFVLSDDPSSPVYAVMWVKSSKSLVVGLALADIVPGKELDGAPKGMSYKGLSGYFSVAPDDIVPAQLREWANAAYENVAQGKGTS